MVRKKIQWKYWIRRDEIKIQINKVAMNEISS